MALQMHSLIFFPFSFDQNIMNAYLQKGSYIIALKDLRMYE
jgi:hypothetical protein